MLLVCIRLRAARALLAALIAATFVYWPLSASALSVVYPTAGNHTHSAYDTTGDAVVYLTPDPAQNGSESFHLGPVSQAMKDELAGGDSNFGTWTFNYVGASLNGALFVDQYNAKWSADHVGGGEINLRYQKGMGDPANLRWIQLVTDNAPFDPDGPGPLGVYVPPIIDPFPNDADNVGGAPFYYCDPPGGPDCGTFDIANHVNGAVDHGFGTTYDLHFYDFSRRSHPQPFVAPIYWSAQLWLVSWDGVKDNNGPGGKELITFHNGIQWGWTMIPEPSTAVLFGVGLALLAARRTRRAAGQRAAA